MLIVDFSVAMLSLLFEVKISLFCRDSIVDKVELWSEFSLPLLPAVVATALLCDEKYSLFFCHGDGLPIMWRF